MIAEETHHLIESSSLSVETVLILHRNQKIYSNRLQSNQHYRYRYKETHLAIVLWISRVYEDWSAVLSNHPTKNYTSQVNSKLFHLSKNERWWSLWLLFILRPYRRWFTWNSFKNHQISPTNFTTKNKT